MMSARNFYDWGGLNQTLFHLINSTTPEVPSPLVQFLTLAGSYWTAPVVMIGLWLCGVYAGDARRALAFRNALVRFAIAFAVALAAASLLKISLDFPRPAVVFGDTIRVIGQAESRYSLPSGHATFSALVASSLWPLFSARMRWALIMLPILVGWSRIATGMHFPADVLAGWVLGVTSMLVAKRLQAGPFLNAPIAGRWLGLAASIAALDQISKLLVLYRMIPLESRPITSFFNLVHVLNPGAAFSFLADAGGWQRYLFLTIAVIASRWLIAILSRPRPIIEATGFSLILGGALSNAMDRLIRGPVVDFLDFHWNAFHWPAFNIADVAICIGAGMIIFMAFNNSKQASVPIPGDVNASR